MRWLQRTGALIIVTTRMNAALAARADTVTRMFCGLPMELKG